MSDLLESLKVLFMSSYSADYFENTIYHNRLKENKKDKTQVKTIYIKFYINFILILLKVYK